MSLDIVQYQIYSSIKLLLQLTTQTPLLSSIMIVWIRQVVVQLDLATLDLVGLPKDSWTHQMKELLLRQVMLDVLESIFIYWQLMQLMIVRIKEV